MSNTGTTNAVSFSNNAGGDVISVKNFTSNDYSLDDKVWIKHYQYNSGTNAISIGSYSHSGGQTQVWFMPDGQHFIDFSSGTIKYYDRNGTQIGTITYCSRDALCTMPIIFYANGIVYSHNASGMQRVDSGLGWSRADWKPLHGDPSFVYDYANTKVHKINPLDGTVIKSYTVDNSNFNNFKSIQFSGIVYDNNTLILPLSTYLPSNSNITSDNIPSYTLILDDENETATTGVNLNCNRLCSNYCSNSSYNYQNFATIGVTSDKKYAITAIGLLPTGMGAPIAHVYNINDLTNITDDYNESLFGKIYRYGNLIFNPQTEILCYTGITMSGYGYNIDTIADNTTKILQYSNNSWKNLNANVADNAPYSNNIFVGYNHNLTEFYYNYNNTQDTVTYPIYINSYQSFSYYGLVDYSLIDANCWSGYANENIFAGETGQVKTVLPVNINVFVTVDYDWATITVEQ